MGTDASSPTLPTERHAPRLTVVWGGVLGGTTTVPIHSGGLDDAIAAVGPRVVASVPNLGDHAVSPTTLAAMRPGAMARSLPSIRALLDLADRHAQRAGPDALAATGAPDTWVRRALAEHEPKTLSRSPVDRLMQFAASTSLSDQVADEVERAEKALAADPDLSGLEHSWRRLAWLARRLELRGGVRLVAVSDVSLDVLLDGVALADAAATASVVVLDASVGVTARDQARAARMAEIGAAVGVPVIASAAPSLVGAENRSATVPPIRHEADAAFAGWLGLRGRAEARSLALAYPDIRVVPGREVWGGGALAVAVDAAAAWSRGDGLPGLGRAPISDLDADDVSVALSFAQSADLAKAGVCSVAPQGREVRVVSAPSAAQGGSTARDAALSLPAALFTNRIAHAVGDGLSGLHRELEGWGRIEPVESKESIRAVLPATASPTLAADVSVRLSVQP